MSEAHVGPLPEGMKHCRICAEPINKRAMKCIHCQSEQSLWRQRMGLSSTVLALLIALISVTTAALPAIKDFLTPKNSSLSFSYTGATEDYIGVLVSNSGIRPGTLKSASLAREGFPLIPLHIVGLAFNATEIINAGANRQVNFYARRNPMHLDTEAMTKNKVCNIEIKFKEFLGKSSTQNVSANCDELFELIAKASKLDQ